MRIVIDVRRLKDFGIGTYIRNLTHALARIDRENRYILIARSQEVRSLADLPKNFQVAPYDRTDEQPLDHLGFPMFVHKLAPDLVHIPLNRVPVLMIRPYVVTVHDMSSLVFHPSSGLRKSFQAFRFRRGLKRADRIIAVSEATRRDVIKAFDLAPSMVRRIYNAPDPAFFEHRHFADARAAGPEADKLERSRIMERYQIHYPFLLYAGNIRPQKNIPRLVEAFAVARETLSSHPQYKDLRLILIGDEISRNPSIRQTVISSRVEEVVRFLGFVPFDTLRRFYECASAFVFPSLYEGFGLPPLEALASGTPVVTSNLSSLPEVVGEAAVLVNPENVFDIAHGICEVLSNEELRQDLIRKGLEQASRFSWEQTACQVLETYKEVVGERK